MRDLAQHLTAEAYNNAWANHRLLKACCELTREEFAATRTSFFPSIKATLNHILTVDCYYMEALERSRQGLAPHDNPGRHYEPEEPFDDCAALAAAQREADRRLIAYCEALDDSQLDDVVLIPRRIGLVRERVPLQPVVEGPDTRVERGDVVLRGEMFRCAELVGAAGHQLQGAFELRRRRRRGLSAGALSSAVRNRW